jgi:hypothetical protein
VMVERMARLLGVVVTVGWRRPGNGDGRADCTVPEHGGDGVGGGRGGDDMVPTAEEERDSVFPRHGCEGWVDGTIPRCGDDMVAVRVATVWT